MGKELVNMSIKIAVILIILSSLYLYYLSLTPSSHGISSTNLTKSCNCVIFRMDDIQDYWLESGQITPMDIFLSKNQSLSLGLIMNSTGNDSKIINKVKDGFDRGLFELALHVYNHVDYTNLTEEEQRKSLEMANAKLDSIFGIKTLIFIAPDGTFNNDTIKAMEQNGINVLGSAVYSENAFDGGKSIFNASNISKIRSNMTTDKQQQQQPSVFHVPESVSFEDYKDGKWIKNSINSLIGNVTNYINKYGYAVIVIHPQDFVKLASNNTFVNIVDENETLKLSNLIDLIKSKNITITSFSKIISIQNDDDPCLPGFSVTGYYTPFELVYSNKRKVSINVEDLGKREFDEKFIKDVKIEGWGKTIEGWYLGFDNGKWAKNLVPLNSNEKPLFYGSAAVDNKVIPNLKQLRIPTLISPYNGMTFLANDIGGAIKGKHVDIYTGEGKIAGIETLNITSKNNVVCYN
jgi:peptidoglycan/xylan/chitin deacetylase (PgdA/CDA1 family)/3D (Asp-Asp-Asp) domain-containing protein